jgi:D-hexose-6-phosphate mutarotase
MNATETANRLRRFEIPGRVAILEGNGELPKVEVTTDSSTAEVYLHGAHVTDFQKRGEPPLLFTSQCSRFAAGQPIRGGIPIIFPWFGAREGGPAHGFARVADWELTEAASLPEGGVTLRFAFPGSDESAMCPPFAAYYAVTVTDRLELQLTLINTAAAAPLDIENCLHTYLHVGDIAGVSVTGLQSAAYLDKVEDFAPRTETAEAIKITGEVDRIYMDTTGPVDIHDPSLRRKIRVEKSGSASTVVWNPWSAKAQQMSDFGTEEYKRMLCVESGNVARNKLTLAPGKAAVLRVALSSAPL